MKRASQINKEIKDREFKRLVEEFTEKLKDDPYQPGVVHPKVYVDEISEIIEDVLWIRDHSDLTIRFVKHTDEPCVSVEILERKKSS